MDIKYTMQWYRTWGYQDIFHFYGYVGPLECVFMAPLALFNEGAPRHVFHLMEAPTMSSGALRHGSQRSLKDLICIFENQIIPCFTIFRIMYLFKTLY